MLENPETYLDVRYAKLALVCSRPSCSVQIPPKDGKPPRMRDWIQELPENCLPEEAVMLRAKHLATHIEEVAGSAGVDH